MLELVGGVADGELEHGCAAGEVGEADVDAALEAAADGAVELPGDVGCAEDEDGGRVVPDAVHLYEHFRLDATRGFGFAFAAVAAEGVDFVDEDD